MKLSEPFIFSSEITPLEISIKQLHNSISFKYVIYREPPASVFQLWFNSLTIHESNAAYSEIVLYSQQRGTRCVI